MPSEQKPANSNIDLSGINAEGEKKSPEELQELQKTVELVSKKLHSSTENIRTKLNTAEQIVMGSPETVSGVLKLDVNEVRRLQESKKEQFSEVSAKVKTGIEKVTAALQEKAREAKEHLAPVVSKAMEAVKAKGAELVKRAAILGLDTIGKKLDEKIQKKIAEQADRLNDDILYAETVREVDKSDLPYPLVDTAYDLRMQDNQIKLLDLQAKQQELRNKALDYGPFAKIKEQLQNKDTNTKQGG